MNTFIYKRVRSTNFGSDLWNSLTHPRRRLLVLDVATPSIRSAPFATWTALTLIAVVGSLVYGASLSLVFPRWHPGPAACWLALSAGLSWCVFGPMLVLMSKRSVVVCAHACLVTMAYGEGVLLIGAAGNLLLHGLTWYQPLAFNAGVVALSNVVMAAALTHQLTVLGVRAWKTLLLWVVGLNGTGAVLFTVFQRLLQGGS